MGAVHLIVNDLKKYTATQKLKSLTTKGTRKNRSGKIANEKNQMEKQRGKIASLTTEKLTEKITEN